jgi:beta propeller repeat protein
MRSISLLVSLFLLLLCAACGTNSSGSPDSNDPPQDASDSNDPADSEEGSESGDAPDETGADIVADVPESSELPHTDDVSEETGNTFVIGEGACCLSTDGTTAVWAESGAIWIVTLPDGEPTALSPGTGDQTDPVLSGSRVIWADNRDGDYDLYQWDLSSELESPIVQAMGDQMAPSLDEDDLVWVDRRKPPYDAKSGDIWHWNLLEPLNTAGPLKEDNAEQDHPFVRQGQVVWSDYSADADGFYTEVADPNENNADIHGYDLIGGVPFIVTEDLSKQLRPTIEDGVVVWLDWRGIQPQPKYAEFGLYMRDLSVDGPEVKIAVSGWDHPELWERPFIHGGHVAWIAEDPTDEAGKTELFISKVSSTTAEVPLRLHAGSPVGIDLRQGVIGWVGEGKLRVLGIDEALAESTPVDTP